MKQAAGRSKWLRRFLLSLLTTGLLLSFVLFAPIVPTRPACDFDLPRIFASDFGIHHTSSTWNVIDFPWEVDPRALPLFAKTLRERYGAPAFVAGDRVYSTIGLRFAAPYRFKFSLLAPRFVFDDDAWRLLASKFRFVDLLPYGVVYPRRQAAATSIFVEQEIWRRTLGARDTYNYRIDYKLLYENAGFLPSCHPLRELIGAERALLWSDELSDIVVRRNPLPLPPELQEQLNKILESPP